VLEADDVCVADDNQGRRLDPSDVLGGPGERRRVEPLHLLDQPGEVLGVRRDLEVGFFDRGPGEHLGRDAREHLLQLRLRAVARVGDRGEHQPARQAGVADGKLEGGGAAHAEAEDVGVVEVEVTDQGGHVVGHVLVGDGAVYVGRAPVPLQLDGDHPPGLC